MSTKRFAKDYLEEAAFRLDTAKLALGRKRFNAVAREAQLVVELSLKAFLFRWNFAVPKSHDVSQDIMDSKELFSEYVQGRLDEVVHISKRLRREYEISLYGDIQENTSLCDLYTFEQAQGFYEDAMMVYSLCLKELKDFLED